ncbi:filamentation protein-like protein [Polyplosphaeria fusca]|uniref:Filamentation protein-like protein n=1 Tax=Polyplosphaeria fusca TaxID=682080 RepID=A0A9P4R4Z4_9PLEO|nr:filamentation protein-like protein [Polyplosphaeria fusca]
MGNLQESEKAQRYIAQLDEARCAGRWKDVPELCRKVEKHAPRRRCLTLTARSEAQIVAHTLQRPSTSASTASSGLSGVIPSLLTAIDEESDYAQDAFQATICLGWLHYALEEPGLAVARFPKDFGAVASRFGRESALSGWSRVCIVKGTYLKGSAQEKIGALDEALETYPTVIPWLSTFPTLHTESVQFKMWTEHLLVRLCQLSDQSSEGGEYVEPLDALQTYRFWARYWETTAKHTSGEGPNTARYRRRAWKCYYDTLSIILRHRLPYTPESTSSTNASEKPRQHNANQNLQQRAELKRVEAVYEGILLKETSFPKASESNNEIETWADAVMDNWRHLCGPSWSDEDLGEGGKEGVGRGVLDILYRAATKTFHSTPILRHLFTVHASLAEFDLAFKAYDSYVEIITRGKDRTEQTGEDEGGLDDASTILRTAAEAIRILCRFGSRKEAEKAIAIGESIEKWLEQTIHAKSPTSETNSSLTLEHAIVPRSLAVAYAALGIAQAHWARFTYEADTRSSIQARGVRYLRKSLEPKFDSPDSIEALYALSLVFAEMRDIAGAIKTAKRALSTATTQTGLMSADGDISSGLNTEFGRERKLIPVWHLLALLLTTRSEFGSAEKACEAAFEQFGDPAVLFGKEDEQYRSEHLNNATGRRAEGYDVGIVDLMEGFEKNGILQIKMTQLTLLETLEGSHAAVDGSDELLALYARLFGDPAAEHAKLQPPITAPAPPKSAVGTIRGSIFRSRGSVKSTIDRAAQTSSVVSSRPSTMATSTTAAPTIQVTDEDTTGHSSGHPHLNHHRKHEEVRPGPSRTQSKLQKRSSNSLHRRSESQADQLPEVPILPDGIANGTHARSSSAGEKSPGTHSMSNSVRKSIESHDRPLRSVAHNMPHASEPPPAGHSTQPPKQDVRLPAPFPDAGYIPPDPRFSLIQGRRQKVTILIGIWIFISGLYTRAGMFEDAQGAVTEALKLVESFESEIAQETSSSKAFADRGWGGGKSVEELWADAFSAQGVLLATQSRKHEARIVFERAVLHHPDHSEAIVGLSNILLDTYTKIVPLEPIEDAEVIRPLSPPSIPSISEAKPEYKKQHLSSHTPSAENQLSPPELSRLAARDRAHGLLSTLTKLGPGWDNSEAWYALARAYEESGQVEKTKEVLWWCVELEDSRPIRNWNNVALGGFVL